MSDGFRGKRVLVTGGAGAIGSNLAIRLVKEGASVTVMDSMLHHYGGNLFNLEPVKNQLHINFSDMRDPHTISYIVEEKDYIFNLAGQISHTDSMKDPVTDMRINLEAQITFLEACRQRNPGVMIVFASTRQFYGSPQYLPVDEKHPLNPPDPNGINKLAGEQYHLLYSKIHGLKTTALRLTNTYGPRQLIRNARQGFIGWFVNRVVLDKAIQIFGDGMQIRDFNFVSDVVEGLLLASMKPGCIGKVFNLSGDRSNLKDLAELMVRLAGKGQIEMIPFPEERKKIDIGDFYGDSTLFQSTTGWRPKTTLENGLRRTLDFYQKHLSRYVP